MQVLSPFPLISSPITDESSDGVVPTSVRPADLCKSLSTFNLSLSDFACVFVASLLSSDDMVGSSAHLSMILPGVRFVTLAIPLSS